MSTDLAILEAPGPMSALTQRVISADNAAIETRQYRASPLTSRQRRTIKNRIRNIDRELKKVQIEELVSVYAALKERLEYLQRERDDLKTHLAEHPDDTEAQERVREVVSEGQPLLERYRVVKHQLTPHMDLSRQRDYLQHMLDDHPIAVMRIKKEKQLRQELEKEAGIYGDIIIDRWTRLGFCHRYTVKGKEKIKKVKFSNVGITLDALYFEIETSNKTAFGGWNVHVPDGVYIGKDLLNENTLVELSVACKRQVTGHINNFGAWVIVHRLESADGLMNYVRFSDVMQRYPTNDTSNLPVPVGVSYNREIQWASLGEFPHWLIGGYTGSGKSNAINNGICSLIRTQSPENLRIVLCDLKGGLEFSFYSEIPHLHGQIVDSVKGVSEMLMQLQAIMESRFKKLKGSAKKIEDYNLRYPDNPMPRILCVFDEVASIHGHGNTTREIEASLLDITRLGRAVGIHMWLCTQQPDANVIPTGIKTNCPLRMSGRMPTSSASVTILGNASAAALAAVRGRMILQYGPDPMPIQTPHISDEEIAESLAIARAMPKPEPLETGDIRTLAQRGWTAEMIIKFSLTHMNGLISGKRLYEAIGDDALTQMQSNRFAEQIWKMAPLEFEGKMYKLEKRRGGARYLVEVAPQDAEILGSDGVPNTEPSPETLSEA